MPRALKVYRTAIGFHDAYVAAPSKKAALAAWGAKKDLFAIGSAEVVTDPALTAAPLAAPGTVVTRSRGDLSQQLAAAGPARTRSAAARKPPPRARKPKPPPSRDRLDEAESALAAFENETEAELAALRRREEALAEERRKLERKHGIEAAKLERQLAQERRRYEQAMDRWRRSG